MAIGIRHFLPLLVPLYPPNITRLLLRLIAECERRPDGNGAGIWGVFHIFLLTSFIEYKYRFDDWISDTFTIGYLQPIR